MNMGELLKIVIACVILSSVLQALGATQWLATLCCFGMSFFWTVPNKG